MKDKYEISLWEDYYDNDAGRYKEKKIAIIGSDSITAACRALEPKLVENINGTHTLTFKMYYVCQDEDHNGEKYSNPFLKYLVNERKIKAKWKGNWYDFIIKKCQESSDGKSITYTCSDLYINELSKTGFNIEWDTELENNQGTAAELAEKVLEGTDWTFDNANSEVVQQKKDEAVYEVTTSGSLSVEDETAGTSATIPSGSLILIYYNQIQELFKSSASSGNAYIQFAYADTYETDTNSQLVTNAHCYSWANVHWVKTSTTSITINNNCVISDIYQVSYRYRASRLVRSQKCVLDPLTDRYCYVYKANSDGDDYDQNDIIYCYHAIEYMEPTMIYDLIVNGKGFTSTDGWRGDGLRFELYPLYTDTTSLTDYSSKSYMRLEQGEVYHNAAIRQSSVYLEDGFTKGEKYILRLKARQDYNGHPGASYITGNILDPSNNAIKIEDTENGNTSYFGTVAYTPYDPDDPDRQRDPNWIEYTLTCTKSSSRSNIYSKNIQLMLKPTETFWLEELQLYPLAYGEINGLVKRMNPGELDKQSIAAMHYVYYNHTRNQGLLNEEGLVKLYDDETDWGNSDLLPQYNDNFEKIRSIDIKESNRFNILQTIAETFECWLDFTIIHNENTGEIEYDNTTQKLKKYVSLKNTIGQETGVGFVYGIDLKTIERTIQSDQIVTKTIVSANSNEFGTNGFCTIARSESNYPRVNFILNFDYYINQGLLDAAQLATDLYGVNGYFTKLHQLNIEYDELTNWIIQKRGELLSQESYLTIYDAGRTAATTQIQNLKNELTRLADVTDYNNALDYIQKNAEEASVTNRMENISSLTQSYESYNSMYTTLSQSVRNLQALVDEKINDQNQLIAQIDGLHAAFYKKYSRFIQEGSWISEDYIDDNLYYFDAMDVAHTSARPQISYNISVLRLSSLEEFKNKVFRLGDVAYVQDTEFFGYTTVGGVKTPYKEKVLISEITSYFDEPEKDAFKVQNYKTQFEDLFQRITSTTQSLQLASGDYARAASIIEPDGTIKAETLQSSISKNDQLVESSKSNTIVKDSTGITITDLENPNHQTKITAGGIFITVNGGIDWVNAIRGDGLVTQNLTSGAISTTNIQIYDGLHSSYRWDTHGLTAYYNEQGTGINLSKFVRFDHYGIYGLENNSGEEFVPQSEDNIYDNAKFGMTWNRFFMKNSDTGHRGVIEVSTDNDIRVLQGDVPRVKIGRINAEGTKYGIKIYDENGEENLVTGDDGTLWLKNALYIGPENGYSVKFGYFINDGYPQVFNANDNFIVYSDGSVMANNGTFSGEIHATSGEFTGAVYATEGKIGPLNVHESTVDITENGVNYLTFNDKGISIYNGGLAIYDGNNNSVVYINPQGQLEVKGVIRADTLYAYDGTIGGFTIGSNTLSSANGSLVLNGSDGTIMINSRLTAREAVLSQDAYVADKLYLGFPPEGDRPAQVGATIFNPFTGDNESHKILEAGAMNMFADGIIKTGEITIDGVRSIITSESYTIAPTYAEFENIIARGKITTSVFEVNKVQSVGGAMIFKPSYKVTGGEITDGKVYLYLDENIGDADLAEHYIYLVTQSGKFLDKYEQIESVGSREVTDAEGNTSTKSVLILGTSENLTVFLLDSASKKLKDSSSGGGAYLKVVDDSNQGEAYLEIEDIFNVVDLGKDGDIIIGINSNEDAMKYLRPRGLTISTFNHSDSEGDNTVPNVFLGDFSRTNFGESGLKGFGLYCNNVYLTGSLITQSGNTFAGVNTLDGILKNDSPVVMYAGAISLEDTPNAPFVVTQDGSLYASKGIFEGSLITKSVIQGADIYALRIHGGTTEAPNTLSFYGINNKIIFYDGEYDESNPTAIPLFRIDNGGLAFGETEDYFINIENSLAYAEFASIKTEYTTINSVDYKLGIVDNKIYGIAFEDDDENEIGNITFLKNKLSIGLESEGHIELTQTGADTFTSIKTSKTNIDRDMSLGNSMSYEQIVDNGTIIGYDLYVREV